MKYTTNPAYAARGLKELLEYMALVKRDGNYFENENNIFESDKIHGLLFLDNIETGEPLSENISVVKFGDKTQISELR